MKFNPEYKEPNLLKKEDTIQFNLKEEGMSQFVVREGNDIMLRWLDHVDKST